MSPPQLLHHTVTKARMDRQIPADADPSRSWLVVRPFEPGIEPAFLGSVWFFDDGRAELRSPALHLLPLQPDPGMPELHYLNLFFDGQTGGLAVLDRSPGWRRLDVLFAVPEPRNGLRVRILVHRPGGTSVAATDAGVITQRHGRWEFQPTARNVLPFTPAPPPPLRPAFVGGAPKSGTTWMQLLLNQHEAVHAMGEGSLLNPVSVRPWEPVNRWFPRHMSPEAHTQYATAAVLQRTLETFCRHLGCSWVIDKSPGNAHGYRRLLAFQPQAKLVHCVRHPLDVVVSRLHHEANLIGKGHPSPDLERHAAVIRLLPALLAEPGPLLLDAPLWALVAGVLEDYAQAQREALVTLVERPGALLVVRYEDMLHDAEACAKRVFDHLGVPITPEQVATCVRSVSFANLRERRSGRDHQFFRSGTAQQYLERFSRPDQARAIAHLRAVLPRFDEFGYGALTNRP